MSSVSQSSNWRALAADKKHRQEAAIPKEWRIPPVPDTQLDVTSVPEKCGLLTEKELEITNTDVTTLLARLSSAQWSSVEVTLAFYKRAIVAQQVVNCLTEIFVERALARARELDEHLKTTGRVVGLLHGLPVSCKDMIRIKGLETTMGYASWVGKYNEDNSVIVDILYELGANPFVQTNVPQTLMWGETNNLIFGRTLNPHNRSLTSGGSSGGEGALLAMRGSPLGIGSDIAGSIRIPSAFNGLYGVRPSYGRIPFSGALSILEGSDTSPAVFGPIAHDVASVKIFMQAVLSTKPWLRDPLVVKKEWDERAYKLEEHGGNGGKLCFAICWDNGMVVPHPPVRRALEMTRDALVTAGHRVIDWVPHRHAEMYEILNAIWAVGAEEQKIVTSTSGEPILTSMDPNEPVPEDFNVHKAATTPTPASALWQKQKAKRDIREEYLARWENTAKATGTGRPVDAIISPVAPYAAPPHGSNRDISYTAMWSALDYPSFAFPVTRVDPALDVQTPRDKFLSALDEEIFNLYDPSKFVNASVGLQLSGRTLEEEAVIAMTELVDAALKSFRDQ
ncbi:hypothetical protein EIP91_010541 [Steccherinum ochraceum]|uniref:amidase n=1 Tax=Steccherinum ochraceum TaxID=92696 RepID=A0A4R0R8E0_9APHY|nr:hypothetical protein EIP91_010541 [Steccherinum ochraceum]